MWADRLARENPAGRTLVDREQGTGLDDGAELVGSFEREEAAPTAVLADIQLDALAGCVPQLGEHLLGTVEEGHRRSRVSAPLQQGGAWHVASLVVAANQPVCLERLCQPVGGRPTEPGTFDEARERGRCVTHQLDEPDGLVQHTDPADRIV
jgi:hypothetical protein